MHVILEVEINWLFLMMMMMMLLLLLLLDLLLRVWYWCPLRALSPAISGLQGQNPGKSLHVGSQEKSCSNTDRFTTNV